LGAYLEILTEAIFLGTEKIFRRYPRHFGNRTRYRREMTNSNQVYVTTFDNT